MDNNLRRILRLELKDAFQNNNLDEMISLYESIAFMDTPVEQGVADEWISSLASFYGYSESMLACHKTLLNTESFMKKVLYIACEKTYNEAMTANKGLVLIYEKAGILKGELEKVNLANADCEKFEKIISRSVIKAYQLRNNSSHTSDEWPVSEMFNNIKAVLIATFYAVWVNREALSTAKQKSTNKRVYAIDDYLNNIVKTYNKKISDGFSYVPLIWTAESVNGTSSDQKSMQISSLRGEKHIMLIGEAGCGKSTSVDYLEYQDANEYLSKTNTVIPVKVELIHTDCTMTIKEIICHKLNIPMDYCEELLGNKSIHLYVDGLNEIIAEDSTRKSFVLSLQRFLDEHPQIFTVITDRKYTAFKLNINKRYYLKPLSKDDVLRYAKSKKAYTNQIGELLTTLVDKQEFEDLEFTPFIINQLVEIFASGYGIPVDVSELTGLYLNALLKREYEEKKEYDAAPGRLDLLLMRLALEEIPENGISKIKALKIFVEAQKEYGLQIEAEKCLNLAVQLGVLVASDNNLDFAMEEYRSYYLIRAIELDI